jgi:GNAT superfamily N-acetyltransferase
VPDTLPRTRPATAIDQTPLAAVLARAFASDPLMHWIFPNEPNRQLSAVRFFELMLDLDLRRGTAFTTEDRAGTALWHAPHTSSDTSPGVLHGLWTAARFLALLRGDAWRVGRGLGALAPLHPSQPHWYLSYIGIDPQRQGCGIGSALLQPALKQCDAEGVPAYLVTATGAPFYEKHGFCTVGEHRIANGPLLWRMLRQPA